MIENAIQIICVYAIPLIFAITLHEAAHGWAAKKLGDDTAWILGRVTANPVPHIDPVGTVLVPGAPLSRAARASSSAGPSPCRSIRVTSGTSTAT